MRHYDQLVAAGAFGRGDGAQVRKCGLYLSLGTREIVLRRFARWEGTKAYVECRNLALKACDLLQLIQWQDQCACFERRAAVINPGYSEFGALNIEWVASRLVEVCGKQIPENHFWLAIAKTPSRFEGERVEFERVGLPAVGERGVLRSDLHHV